MKILFVGDVFGTDGVKFLSDNLEKIKKEYKANLVIVNGENAAGGKGITRNIYKDFMKMGVAGITMGNHAFSNKEIDELLDENLNICVPANYPTYKDKGYLTIKYNDLKIVVINVLGRVYMNLPLECSFKTVKEIIEKEKADYYIVDIHAEATSEKKAIGYYLDGIKGAVVGTHTHVQTADECILEKGTMYISDVGMTGPIDGVIGVDKDVIIERFMTGKPSKHVCAKGRMQISAVLLDFDLNKIERIHIIGENTTN